MSSLMSGVVKIPSFDNTLGALFIGSSLAGIFYGVGCLQMFLWMTGKRAESDRPWFKTFVFLLFVLETAHQAMMMAAIYRFLITDYLDPSALLSGGPGSGRIFTYAQSVLLACTILMIQMFFCWRIWILSAAGFEMPQRIAFTVITIILAMFSFSTNVDLAVRGFGHRLWTGNTPEFVLAYKLSTGSQVAFDVMVAFAMTFSLNRARSGISRTAYHVITLIMLFTMNTNLLTTLLSIGELVTFLALPSATVYGGFGFLMGRTYFNSFLAVLNSRDFLNEKLSGATSFSTEPAVSVKLSITHSTGRTAEPSVTAGDFDISLVDIPSFNTKDPMVGEPDPGEV